jgi:formylglycine-generating enzyme required for sulfatase activity
LPQDSGTFKMGEDAKIREVSVNPFLLHQFCVTNLEFERFDPRHKERRWRTGEKHRAVMELNDDLSADNDCPVVMVTWYDAISYARWLGVFINAKGNRYEIRLPTEEEWEYACRAGRETRFTFDGARPTEACTPEYCNYDGNYPDDGEGTGEYRECTLPVDGQIPASWSAALEITAVKGRNRWGFYQMHGNVWEWCDSLYKQGASWRVLRGCSWGNGGGNCRSARRTARVPGSRSHSDGFRLAAVPAGAKSSEARA